MSQQSFLQKQTNCQLLFETFPKIFNACTQEDYTLLFANDDDYKAATGILGICAKLFPGVRIFTFELMSNHLHLVLSGTEEDIQALFGMFKLRYGRYLERTGRLILLKSLALKLFPIDSLDYLRNGIAYTNRNGFVIHDDVTPFNYKWGANACFFSPQLREYYILCKKPMTVRQIRELMHSKDGDGITDLYTLNGCVCPYSFCDIDSGEAFFRDAKHYFYKISRDVESYNEIAKILGESMYYTDDDLYLSATRICQGKYGTRNLTTLPSEVKMDLARILHYDYNASDKQIKRLLKINDEVLTALF